MTRMSKQGERRALNPKKRSYKIFKKSGSKKDNLNKGFKEHVNALESKEIFIGKVK